ncbi:hypothetical protein KI387_021129 [Taxus chinensis]|uniref:Uncharacterized protein n=1 Tax=Taxus chinensis TaxID=29808 RepID=A0AA38GDF9_TAXCH|nr:hypothetical protein KI387_021129 [Taxus chinensis]
MESLDAYIYEKDDDDKNEGGEDHMIYEVHDSKEEGDEEKNYKEEDEAQGKGMSREVYTKDQRTPSLTKELIEEYKKREVVGIIKNFVEQEVERIVDEVPQEVEEGKRRKRK